MEAVGAGRVQLESRGRQGAADGIDDHGPDLAPLEFLAHIYGFTAAHAPVIHLRKAAGGSMVSNYLDSVERVWDRARELEP